MYGQDKQGARTGGSIMGQQAREQANCDLTGSWPSAQARDAALQSAQMTATYKQQRNDPAPAPKPELQEYLDRLGSAVDYAEHLAAQVAERTHGVLRPQSPTGAGCETETAGPSTFYGQQVQNSITRIAGVSARLQDMLDRLEA